MTAAQPLAALFDHAIHSAASDLNRKRMVEPLAEP